MISLLFACLRFVNPVGHSCDWVGQRVVAYNKRITNLELGYEAILSETLLRVHIRLRSLLKYFPYDPLPTCNAKRSRRPSGYVEICESLMNAIKKRESFALDRNP